MKIVKSFTEIERFEPMTYVEDLNVSVDVCQFYVLITELDEAMKAGRKCRRHQLTPKQGETGYGVLDSLMAMGFDDVCAKLRADEFEPPECVEEYKRLKRPGPRTFSPFAKVRKQDLTKLTPAKLPKALLAGQVKRIVCSRYFTDDYAADAAVKYREGWIETYDVARDIVNDGSVGWRLTMEGERRARLYLYSFASYVVEFVA